jgi:hypothetical protein
VAPRSDDDPLDSLLRRIARQSAGLSIDDIAVVVGDALKSQKRDLVGHMQRMLTLERLKNSDPKHESRYRNLHARLVAVESAVRILKKDRSR